MLTYGSIITGNSSAVHLLLGTLLADGLVRISGIPAANEEESVVATHDLARHLVPIGETPLHGAFWERGSSAKTCLSDFTTGDAGNVAYSAEEIRPHVDGGYLVLPPRAKLMHCVHFAGASRSLAYPDNYFVDARRVADALTLAQRDVLATRNVTIRYVDGKSGVESTTEARTLAFDKSGMLHRVVWNAHDRVAGSFDAATASALDAFDALLHRPSLQVHLELRPGQAVLVDNWRVLHARGSYPASMRRRLVGADFPNDHIARRLSETANEGEAHADACHTDDEYTVRPIDE